jgi:hypothetical protein
MRGTKNGFDKGFVEPTYIYPIQGEGSITLFKKPASCVEDLASTNELSTSVSAPPAGYK